MAHYAQQAALQPILTTAAAIWHIGVWIRCISSQISFVEIILSCFIAKCFHAHWHK